MSNSFSDESSLCISRKRIGKGFIYLDEDEKKIDDVLTLERIQSLAVPPAWRDVLICATGKGKILAQGTDAKGRRQYIYHPKWIELTQKEKFAKLAEFGELLPRIRKECYSIVNQKDYSRSYILALMVLILDETGIRIGNRRYKQENDTYGLTSLRRKHLKVDEKVLIFEYKGKSNKERHVEIDDSKLIKHIKQSSEQQGYQLFRYKDVDGHWHSISSEDVNDFIHNIAPGFSSKYFRTWVANRLAIELWKEAKESSTNSKKATSNILMEMVAQELGNTASICREYYIHPQVLKLSQEDALPELEVSSGESAISVHETAEEELRMIIRK